MNDYKFSEHIGDGAHGHVSKAFSMQTSKWVALKKIRCSGGGGGGGDDTADNNVMREIKILSTIDCKYVMQLLDYFVDEGECECECGGGGGVVLVFEFMPTGLWEILHDVQNTAAAAGVIKTYACMLLKGVRYLHERHIMHRDLKPANLLVSERGILKIADLGMSRTMWRRGGQGGEQQAEEKEEEEGGGGGGGGGRPYTGQVATRWYRAPEVLYGSRFYDQSVDLWAIGCILAEMTTKTPLFAGENDIEQLAIVVRSLGTPTVQSWPAIERLPDYGKITFAPGAGKPLRQLIPDVDDDCLLDLVKSFLYYDGAKRSTAKQALSHAYFFKRPLPVAERSMPVPTHNHRNAIRHQSSEAKTQMAYDRYFDTMYSFVKRD